MPMPHHTTPRAAVPNPAEPCRVYLSTPTFAEDRIIDNHYHRVFIQHYRVCICFSDRDTLDDLRVKDMTLKKKKDPILVDFAAKVRNMRHSIPLTQEQLAERAGFHVNYIGGIERAERNPSLTSLCSLSKALGYPLKDLLPNM